MDRRGSGGSHYILQSSFNGGRFLRVRIKRAIVLLLVAASVAAASFAQTNAGSASPQAPAAGAAAPAPQTPSPAQPSGATSQQPAAGKPSTPVEKASSAAHAPLISDGAMTQDQLKDLLLKAYFAESRLLDLLSVAQPEKWNLSAADSAAFVRYRADLQTALKNFESVRYQYSYHLDQNALAPQTAAALGGVFAALDPVVRAIAQHAGAQQAASFADASQQLHATRNKLKLYKAFLDSQAQAAMQAAVAPVPGVPGQPGLAVERINAPAATAAPLSVISSESPPLNDAQVKRLLYQVYVPEFRLKDLAAHDHPTNNKASGQAVAGFNSVRQSLLGTLDQLEKWRGQLSQSPLELVAGFETYRSIQKTVELAHQMTAQVTQLEDPGAGLQYEKAASQMESQVPKLVDYLLFLMRNSDNTLSLFQSDLASCQNQMNYSMRGQRPAAVSMHNVAPDFKGRHVAENRAKRQAKEAARQAARKPSSSQHGSRRHKKRKKAAGVSKTAAVQSSAKQP
jgi:hypothetical protein